MIIACSFIIKIIEKHNYNVSCVNNADAYITVYIFSNGTNYDLASNISEKFIKITVLIKIWCGIIHIYINFVLKMFLIVMWNCVHSP